MELPLCPSQYRRGCKLCHPYPAYYLRTHCPLLCMTPELGLLDPILPSTVVITGKDPRPVHLHGCVAPEGDRLPGVLFEPVTQQPVHTRYFRFMRSR